MNYEYLVQQPCGICTTPLKAKINVGIRWFVSVLIMGLRLLNVNQAINENKLVGVVKKQLINTTIMYIWAWNNPNENIFVQENDEKLL